MTVDPGLVRIWLMGWTLAHGTPPPVAMKDCWRVDVGLPDQKARYVFPAASPELPRLAGAIAQPFVYLKALLAPGELAALLPPGWQLDPPRFMMRRATLQSPTPVLPAGYRLQVAPDTKVSDVRIHTAAGELAASGRLACVGGHAIFNRIETALGHRRRGLGRAVVRALDGLARDSGARQGVLMATEEGRALYETLDWRVCSPYASAVIPGKR